MEITIRVNSKCESYLHFLCDARDAGVSLLHLTHLLLRAGNGLAQTLSV